MHFRKKIGKDGLEFILEESIHVNDDDRPESGDRVAYIDSTVQDKISATQLIQNYKL